MGMKEQLNPRISSGGGAQRRLEGWEAGAISLMSVLLTRLPNASGSHHSADGASNGEAYGAASFFKARTRKACPKISKYNLWLVVRVT
jgi:hypothetical protein